MMSVSARPGMRSMLIAAVVTASLFTAAGHDVARAADAAAPVHYTSDPAKSSFEYQFSQAGALNKGKFTKYTVTLDAAGDTLGKLDVVVEMGSLDTGDKERDDTLKSADLFSVARFPQSHFTSTQITRTASGYDAAGKLTIRGVSRDVHVPFTFRIADGQGVLSGKTAIKRLDYGVGQGDWKATDQVGNDVTVSFAIRLAPAAH